MFQASVADRKILPAVCLSCFSQINKSADPVPVRKNIGHTEVSMRKDRFFRGTVGFQPPEKFLRAGKSIFPESFFLHVIKIHQAIFHIVSCRLQLDVQRTVAGAVCDVYFPQHSQSLADNLQQAFRIFHISIFTDHFSGNPGHQTAGFVPHNFICQDFRYRYFMCQPPADPVFIVRLRGYSLYFQHSVFCRQDPRAGHSDIIFFPLTAIQPCLYLFRYPFHVIPPGFSDNLSQIFSGFPDHCGKVPPAPHTEPLSGFLPPTDQASHRVRSDPVPSVSGLSD